MNLGEDTNILIIASINYHHELERRQLQQKARRWESDSFLIFQASDFDLKSA
jgi:hypothetical protein